MRLYLDNCCLQRPLDDQTQPRIRVETEAVLAILAAAQAGDVQLVSSEVLELEIAQIPDEQRRSEAEAILRISNERLIASDPAIAHAESLEASGLGAIDALHVAVASEGRVDYLVTCDDRLLKRVQHLEGLSCKVISALSLVFEATS